MTQTENTSIETQTAHPGAKRLAPCGNRSTGGGRALTAIVLSSLALLISCGTFALVLQRLPREQEPEMIEEEVPEEPMLQYGGHTLPIMDSVPVNAYDKALFQRDENGFIHYQDAPLGIDVSSYQGEIDWEQVAASDIRFAMLRLGLRGYTKGGIMDDATFERNIDGALAAGLDVGVYFFSQATDAQEAEEEADYVLEHLAGRGITYPVVFDWESVGDSEARTNNVDSDMVTRCANAFCDKIRAAGYTPMIYFNTEQGYLSYQLDKLCDNAFWLAEYHEHPGFYYHFDFWQYTHTGSVPGIGGAVDLDLDLRGYGLPI